MFLIWIGVAVIQICIVIKIKITECVIFVYTIVYMLHFNKIWLLSKGALIPKSDFVFISNHQQDVGKGSGLACVHTVSDFFKCKRSKGKQIILKNQIVLIRR